jgi:RHH-type rel operon transcriptional repressor/antitoxin RelB
MPLSIRLTADEEARLGALATRTGRSKTFYVRRAIHAYLADLEEQYWADEAILEWEASGKTSRPAAQLWDELGASAAGASDLGAVGRHHRPAPGEDHE